MSDGPDIAAIEARLVEALGRRTGSTPDPRADLRALGIDSVELAGLVYEIEDAFGIRVDEEVFDVGTLAELARYIGARQGAA